MPLGTVRSIPFPLTHEPAARAPSEHRLPRSRRSRPSSHAAASLIPSSSRGIRSTPSLFAMIQVESLTKRFAGFHRDQGPQSLQLTKARSFRLPRPERRRKKHHHAYPHRLHAPVLRPGLHRPDSISFPSLVEARRHIGYLPESTPALPRYAGQRIPPLSGRPYEGRRLRRYQRARRRRPRGLQPRLR